MMAGINDSEAASPAKAAGAGSQRTCKFNLIPFHPSGLAFRRSPAEVQALFCRYPDPGRH